MCGLRNHLITYVRYVSMASFCSSRDKILRPLPEGYRIERAKTEFDLSQLYKNTGRPDLHKEYLYSALSDFKDMGMDFNRYKEKDERSR